MCTGLEIAAVAGAALSVGSTVYQAKQANEAADQDALNEKDAAAQQAENIMKARRKQVASARAATAASGTKLDEFSEINTSDIERGAANDAQMTLLTGQRRGDSLTYGNEARTTGAYASGAADLLTTGYQVGWKGKQKTGTTGGVQ